MYNSSYFSIYSGLEAISTVINATSERQQPHNQINSKKKLRMKQFIQFKNKKYDCQKIIPISGSILTSKNKTKKNLTTKINIFFLAFQSSRN